jgi:hypothetical protein
MNTFDRDEIKYILSNNVATVSFTKNDGTIRDMVCTLREDILPSEFLNGTEQMEKKSRKSNPDVLPVWDIEKKAWRSFRIDAVEFIKIDIEKN